MFILIILYRTTHNLSSEILKFFQNKIPDLVKNLTTVLVQAFRTTRIFQRKNFKISIEIY